MLLINRGKDMNIPMKTRQAYSEVDEFIELLSIEHKNMLPLKLREFFKEEKDENYKKGINPNIPIKNQELKEETLSIIALLNLQYWCKDEKEKERLQKIYSKNEEIYRENMKVLYSSSNMFKKDINLYEDNQETNTQQIVEYKESIFKKIINKILKIIRFK